jgi:hypothetical protein
VLKEIVDPAGAKYDIRNIIVGDETMSVLEIWGSEYQEVSNDCRFRNCYSCSCKSAVQLTA